MGVCYEKGYGVHKDRVLAQEWYRKAAENGSKNAAERLAGPGAV